MHRRAPPAIVCALQVVLLLACSGPFTVFPGGKLDGETKPVPPNWSSAGDHGICQLETNPQAPYSVNIAYTVLDGSLYVNAGDHEARWVKNMAANPEVRLRIDDTLYELRGERVTDEAEIRKFAEAWTGQSMFRRDPTGYDEVYVYRLVAR